MGTAVPETPTTGDRDRLPGLPTAGARDRRAVHHALGAAVTVLNVGAGADSYEPTDREVTAVEPSASMRGQPPTIRPPAMAEVQRVIRGPVVVLAFDPSLLHRFWLARYAPEAIEVQARRDPPIEAIAAGLGGRSTVTPVPIPPHCGDGFSEAYYGCPERGRIAPRIGPIRSGGAGISHAAAAAVRCLYS